MGRSLAGQRFVDLGVCRALANMGILARLAGRLDCGGHAVGSPRGDGVALAALVAGERA